MKTLKEHWPLLLIAAVLLWVIYPGFTSGDYASAIEHPGVALHRKTMENRAFQNAASAMHERSKS